MTIDDLMEEAPQLAKPSLLLDNQPSDLGIVGYWGGSGRRGVRPRECSHWVTIDCSWLNAHGFDVQGCLGIYEVDSNVFPWPNPFFTDYEPSAKLSVSTIPKAEPLFGHEALSFPPLEALCLYGGPRIGEWLSSVGCERTDYDLAYRTKLGDEYSDEWLARTPFMSQKHAAVLGGWHQLWPEDDFYMPREMELLAWTFRDSEPWLEVWKRRQNMRVIARIT